MRQKCLAGVMILGTVAALAAGVEPLAAQAPTSAEQGFGDRPRIGIGYVANAPNMFQGLSGHFLLDAFGGIGLYVDAKRQGDSPGTEPDYLDTLTVAEAKALPGATYLDDGFGWLSVNAAVLRPITSELMAYLGAGYTFEDVYYRYMTQDEDVGNIGHFWVRDEAASRGRINVLGGVFFRVGRYLAFQLGYERMPQGFTVGVSTSASLR